MEGFVLRYSSVNGPRGRCRGDSKLEEFGEDLQEYGEDLLEFGDAHRIIYRSNFTNPRGVDRGVHPDLAGPFRS